MLPLDRYFREAAFSLGLQGLQAQGYDRRATKSQSQFRAMKPCLTWHEIHNPCDMNKSQLRKLVQHGARLRDFQALYDHQQFIHSQSGSSLGVPVMGLQFEAEPRQYGK